MTVTVISASSVHAQPLADIYNYYIANTRITFEMDPVTSVEMAKRIADVQSIGLPWLVALEGDQVVGYAYATQWRARKAYQSSVESTVYLADGHRGRGLGTALYGKLIEELRGLELHAIIGGVAQPNDASARLHEALGFKKVAHFEQVGYKLGQWLMSRTGNCFFQSAPARKIDDFLYPNRQCGAGLVDAKAIPAASPQAGHLASNRPRLEIMRKIIISRP